MSGKSETYALDRSADVELKFGLEKSLIERVDMTPTWTIKKSKELRCYTLIFIFFHSCTNWNVCFFYFTRTRFISRRIGE